jgi:hypothetical protein
VTWCPSNVHAQREFSAPIEMEFAPNGDMYLLEYGTTWFQGNPDARLVRIEYNAGNRKPIVAVAVDRPTGALPMRVQLSSAGTMDLDEDSLRYAWTISRAGGGTVARLSQPNPSYTSRNPVPIRVAHGDRYSRRALHCIRADRGGNEPANVDIDLGGNKTFFFPGVPVVTRYA